MRDQPVRVRVLVDSIELLRAFARLARRARRDDVEVALQLESGFELSGWPTNDSRLSVPVFPAGLEVDEGAGGTGNNQSNFLVDHGTQRRGDHVVFRPRSAGDAIDHFHALVAVRDGVPRAVWRTQRRPGAVRL